MNGIKFNTKTNTTNYIIIDVSKAIIALEHNKYLNDVLNINDINISSRTIIDILFNTYPFMDNISEVISIIEYFSSMYERKELPEDIKEHISDILLDVVNYIYVDMLNYISELDLIASSKYCWLGDDSIVFKL